MGEIKPHEYQASNVCIAVNPHGSVNEVHTLAPLHRARPLPVTRALQKLKKRRGHKYMVYN